MKMSFSTRITSIVLGSIVFLSLGIGITLSIRISDTLHGQTLDRLKKDINVISIYTDEKFDKLAAEARMLSGLSELSAKIEKADKAGLRVLAREAVKASGSSFVLITDASGRVLARGDSEAAGDSVAGRYVVRQALAGTESRGFEKTSDSHLALLGSAPVRIEGRVAGCVVFGDELAGDNVFVDSFKRALDMECTVFAGEERISTTIRKEGARINGSRLDNGAIVASVLGRGETYNASNRINDSNYDTVYWPIKDGQGNILGMFFLGKDRAEEEASVRGILLIILATSLLFMVLSAFASIAFAKRATRPIRELAGNFRELAEGEADLTRTIDIGREDEFGGLADDFNSFVSKLREIVSRLKQSQAELEILGEELRRSAGDTAGAVVQISGSINSVGDKTQAQVASATSSSEAVEGIAKRIDSLQSLIADQAASVTEASASIEEMVGNIGSVRSSTEKMAAEFAELSSSAEAGREIQKSTGLKIAGIAERSASLQSANQAIAKIASQTNLLAMNAAIEAAHAGDAGRGFSVVADEIRSLAETSARQSRSIGAELSAIRKEIAEVVAASGQTELAFAVVMEKLGETDRIVREVDGAMAEQNEGSSQVLEALRSMNEITATVRSESAEMSLGNARILAEMRGLRESADDIRNRMAEMESGAAAITEGARKVSGLAEGTTGTIGRMDAAIGRFKV